MEQLNGDGSGVRVSARVIELLLRLGVNFDDKMIRVMVRVRVK